MRASARPTGQARGNPQILRGSDMERMKEWGSKHTLSIPGGIGKRRNSAVCSPLALCPAPMASDGGADGTVQLSLEFRALGAKRTVRTVPHGALPPIDKKPGQRSEPC